MFEWTCAVSRDSGFHGQKSKRFYRVLFLILSSLHYYCLVLSILLIHDFNLLNLSTLIYAVCHIIVSFITLILCNRSPLRPAPPSPSQPPSLPKYNILIFCNCIYKTCMIHNQQQLLKELFALKIIGIVVLEFVLYCDSPFTLVAILSQA